MGTLLSESVRVIQTITDQGTAVVERVLRDDIREVLTNTAVFISLLVSPVVGVTESTWNQLTKAPIFATTYEDTVVDTLWTAYRDKIQEDGRTIDRDRNFLTTSEGQSYSLLRAVWMDDKDTFDRALKWTNHNLRKRPGDKLFAWLWGQNPDGKWDVLRDEGGINTASDADQDIALALIFAYHRWNQDHYLKQARETLAGIWEKDVIVIRNRPYLVAGNWARQESRPTINPSYFSFAAYPIFADIDPDHPWNQIKDTSYEVLTAATVQPLDTGGSANLPPDWVSVDPETAVVQAPLHSDKAVDFSDDAFRIPWRVALDWEWHRDPRAKRYLDRLSFLKREWENRGMLHGSYRHDGTPLRTEESDSMYGAVLPYYQVMYPDIADEVYEKRIAHLYNPDIEDFQTRLGYYSQNWVWFGMAFRAGKLPNLADISSLSVK